MMSHQRVLAVSPHLDDAVLSAGATLAELAAAGCDVEVCTVFAGSPSEPLSPVAGRFHASCGHPPDSSAIAARIKEDQAAMQELGTANTHYLDFLDAVYRRASDGRWLCAHDRAMFDEHPLDADLYWAMVREIRQVLKEFDPHLVLTCAAIGSHVDHTLTRAAVIKATAGTECRVLLWEDLPYAIQRSHGLSKHDVLILPDESSWQRKWRAIGCYASQVQMLWPSHDDWQSELAEHARARGIGAAGEAFICLTPHVSTRDSDVRSLHRSSPLRRGQSVEPGETDHDLALAPLGCGVFIGLAACWR